MKRITTLVLFLNILCIFAIYGQDNLQSNIEGYEYTDDRKITVFWKPISEFLSDKETLYPEGLLDLLIEDMLVELPAIEYTANEQLARVD